MREEDIDLLAVNLFAIGLVIILILADYGAQIYGTVFKT